MKKQMLLSLLLAWGAAFTNKSIWASKIQLDKKPYSQPCTITKGLFYTVQLGVFSKPIKDGVLGKIGSLFYFRRADGKYDYFCGIYDSRFDAMAKRYRIAASGNRDSHVTAYYNGEKISIAEADEVVAKYGKGVLFNSVPNIKDNLAFVENKEIEK